jgi:transcriptional regulator with XRE-family HTH domain
MINIGENLFKLRRESGMTQKELAEKLGVSFQTVSKWERGVCCPDISVVPVLAELFNTTTDIA